MMERDEMLRGHRMQFDVASLLLRLSLGIGFLSAVADRFGVWGPSGTPSVAWGNFHNFIAYTATLNPWSPAAMAPVLAWTSTLAEVTLGVLLVIGLMTRAAALLSGLLSLTFCLAMTAALGIHAPLNYGVFVYVAGSLLLAACAAPDRWTLDAVIARRKRHV